jgi:uncharacterized membrane protein YphA (DoxX/SURF4 family)
MSQSASGYSLQHFGRWLANSWQTFFHGPIDARRPALVRVLFALALLVYLAVLYPDLDTWYGVHGLVPASADAEMHLPQNWSVLRWLPLDPAANSRWIHGLFWLHIGCTLALLVGFATRPAAIAVFVLLVSWQNRNQLILDGEDSVFRLVSFYLMLMPSGRMWSIDRWLANRWRGSANDRCPLVPAWSLRLLQLHMCVIFIAAGLHKLGGTAWLDGIALSYVSRLDDTFGRFPLPHWFFETPLLVRLTTWAVIVIEIVGPLLLWFKETRRWALLTIVLFHLANEYAMFLFLFHWIMLVGWSTFLTSEDFALLNPLRFFSRSAERT